MSKDLNSIILTPQELQIMKVVWEMGSASVKNVYTILSSRKKIAYTTTLTIMGILESKGVLTHSKSGRAFIYRPLLSKQQAIRNQVAEVLNRFFDGDPEKLLVAIRQESDLGLNRKDADIQPIIESLL